jgi:hypothetical protein
MHAGRLRGRGIIQTERPPLDRLLNRMLRRQRAPGTGLAASDRDVPR